MTTTLLSKDFYRAYDNSSLSQIYTFTGWIQSCGAKLIFDTGLSNTNFIVFENDADATMFVLKWG